VVSVCGGGGGVWSGRGGVGGGVRVRWRSGSEVEEYLNEGHRRTYHTKMWCATFTQDFPVKIKFREVSKFPSFIVFISMKLCVYTLLCTS
jgi:hypothetical protein